ncbi:RNA-binding protein [Chloroflexi bacterium TSY]|nr:RNA-binding protein [Chloroflexi bacterium TSY]
MNIYVGNISFDSNEDSLRAAFGAYGEVTSVNIITDRETGRSRGFGFVEMASSAYAQKAIEGLNGTELDGRTVKVNEAKPRRDNRGGSGGHRNDRW